VKEPNFPERACFLHCVVTSTSDVKEAFRAIESLAGLVTCAGVTGFENEWESDVFAQVMSFNVTGVLNAAKTAAPARRWLSGDMMMPRLSCRTALNIFYQTQSVIDRRMCIARGDSVTDAEQLESTSFIADNRLRRTSNQCVVIHRTAI